MGRSLQELAEQGLGMGAQGGGAAPRSLDEKLPYRTKNIDGSLRHAIHQFADFPGGFDRATRMLAEFEDLRVENWTDPTGGAENLAFLKNYIRYWYAHTVEVHLRSCRARCLQGIVAAQELPEGPDQEQAAYLVETWSRLEPVQKDLRDAEVPLYWEVCGGITRLLAKLGMEDQIDPFVDTDFAFFIRPAKEAEVTHMAIHMKLTQNIREGLEPIYAFFQRRPTQSPDSSKPEWQFVCWNTKAGAVRVDGLASFKKLSDLEPAPYVGASESFDPRIEILTDNKTARHLMENDEHHGRVQGVFAKAGNSSDERTQQILLQNAIDATVKIAQVELDVARLQAFRDKNSKKEVLQFVLPLYILAHDGDMPDLALAISTKISHGTVEDYRDPNNFYYEVKSVLEPMMAYKNCRPLGRINQNWLRPTVYTATAGAASGGGAASPTAFAAQPPSPPAARDRPLGAGGTTFALGQGAPSVGPWRRGQSPPPAAAAAEEQEQEEQPPEAAPPAALPAGAAAQDAAETWHSGSILKFGDGTPDWYGFIKPDEDLGNNVRFWQREWEHISEFEDPPVGGRVEFTLRSGRLMFNNRGEPLLHIKKLRLLES